MKLKASEYRNIFFCGDLHGNLELLLLSLEEVGYDSNYDVIVTMGDTIDRGKDSLGTALFFLDSKKTLNGLPSALSTKGNHEDFGVEAHVYKNRDWIQSWHEHGGDWSMSLDESFLESFFTRIEEQFPLFLDIEYNDKKIVVSHAAIPGYKYDLIHTLKDKFLLKHSLISKQESFPVDEEDEIAVLPVSGVDLAIHGHTLVNDPYLYKNRLYLETGCNKNYLTIMTLNEEKGVSISGFKKVHNGVESLIIKSDLEDKISNILI